MPSLPNPVLRATCAAWLALLAACGGGGGSADGAAAAPQQGAGTADATLADCGIANFSSTALGRINQLRAEGASCGTRGHFASTGALRWNDALAQAAAAHSLDMAAQNYFSHTSADGRSMADRVNAAGFAWSLLGENIAAGQVGIDAVIDGWMSSDGHCANLMNPAFETLGLACTRGASASRYGTYWTLDLARGK